MGQQRVAVAVGRIRRGRWVAPLALLVGIGLLGASGCSGQDGAPSTPAPAARSVASRKLPRLAAPPAAPRLMQAYFNTVDGREWIYDGVRWVPRDRTVDDLAEGLSNRGAEGSAPRAQPNAALSVPFSPTGAHAKHRAYECAACHLVAGSPCLDPAGPAAASGRPAPSFDPTAKTCASVSCHGAYSGTFTYTRWDYGADEVEYVTVPYAGSGGSAGNWYTPGSTCTSCHGNPPGPTSGWHSPAHAASLAAGRRCETCHPDATSAVVNGATVGVSISAAYAGLHGNGVVDVQARFTSKCFGCH